MCLLPGPRSAHWFFGNLKQVIGVQAGEDGIIEGWLQQYGNTLRLHLPFGRSGIYTTDMRAIQHVLSNTDIYQKPPVTRSSLSRIVGPGILVAEGNVNKQPGVGAVKLSS
ncbi:hypothetical protein C8R46DRAFT_519464 [Mycena filopes]|nr:hypothetical protein C8R46DRAFT_519464 [Mycena filopes]